MEDLPLDIESYILGEDFIDESSAPEQVFEDINSGNEFRIRKIPMYNHKALYEARQELGLKSKVVAETIEIEPATYSAYETLRFTPGEDMRNAIIAFYADNGINISHEDILSRETVVAKVITKNAALVEAREEAGLTSTQIAKEIGLHKGHYFRIEAMNNYPSKDLQRKICDYFRSQDVFVLEEDLFPEELKYIAKGEELDKPEIISLDDIDEDILIVNPEEELDHRELKRVLDEVLDTLKNFRPSIVRNSKRHEEVIRYRFGIDVDKLTYKELTTILGVTKERVRQIENKALKALKHPTRARKLRVFYD